MIVMSLMNIVYKLLSLVLDPLNVPGMPDDFIASIETFFGYFKHAADFIGFFLPINLVAFFTIWFAIFAVHHAYPLIMWILRKIPFLNLK